ncbi:Uncharacterized protein APZ42_002602, partial [Daphnia magna]
MAKDLLCIPATSAASERVFSAGKDVFGIARMSLNPETVEALVCLRSWYRAGLVNEDDIEVKIQKFVGQKSEVHQSKLTSLVIRNQIFRYLPVFYHTQSFLKDMGFLSLYKA